MMMYLYLTKFIKMFLNPPFDYKVIFRGLKWVCDSYVEYHCSTLNENLKLIALHDYVGFDNEFYIVTRNNNQYLINYLELNL